MNPFLQVLETAADSRRTHHKRAAQHTREHFARHPECRKIIVSMDADGYVTRAKGEIDIEARCRSGWFKESMWKGTYYQAHRPVEAISEEVKETIWLETKTGHAVDVHKFMHTYLKALHQTTVPTRSSARPQRSHRPTALKGVAPMI